jgi:hypothetical protein
MHFQYRGEFSQAAARSNLNRIGDTHAGCFARRRVLRFEIGLTAAVPARES